MTFFQAINTCLSKYTIFSGRAKRSEYWYWRLFELFLALLAFRLDMIFFSNSETGSISLFVFFFTCIPGIAVSVRRLHDINKTGFAVLVQLIPIIGIIIFIVWAVTEGDKKKNYYGPRPKK